MRRQQHFLVALDQHRALLRRLPLAGRRVVEPGVGHGALTRLILAGSPAAVIGYEIDATLSVPVHPSLTVHFADFRSADLSWVQPTDALIANPPYAILPHILALIDRVGIADVVLMVPPRYRAALPGAAVAFSLGAGAFSPPAEGQHLVLCRGFGHQGSW